MHRPLADKLVARVASASSKKEEQEQEERVENHRSDPPKETMREPSVHKKIREPGEGGTNEKRDENRNENMDEEEKKYKKENCYREGE